MSTSPEQSARVKVALSPGTARRTLLIAGIAHALHDGFSDTIYVLLPVWQTQFLLGYATLALLRGGYSGTMAILQVPAGRLSARLGIRFTLALGTVLAALGYAWAGSAGGVAALLAALALAGAGSSAQHPLASAAVSRAYGGASRGPLGVYNFAGDLGKAALPAFASLLIVRLTWRGTLPVLALVGLAVAGAILVLMPAPSAAVAARPEKPQSSAGRGGFTLLLAIGILDSGARMGFLMFLPFLMRAKGADVPLIGLSLSLVFLGGAAGKFVCGWLGEFLGVLPTVIGTEVGTALSILVLLSLPLAPAFALLPLLGLLLNGTSSVLYGTVPELAAPGRAEHMFALFYTGTIGSSALSPVAFGVIGDLAGTSSGALCAAAAALLTCPLAVLLAPKLGT